MGRPKRADEAGSIYHMLNRANRRETIFHKDVDYEAFENVLLEALAPLPQQLRNSRILRFFSAWVLT